VHRARLLDRLLVRPERRAGGGEPRVPAAVVRLRPVRAPPAASRVRPAHRALPARLPLRPARVELGGRRGGAAAHEPRVARRLHRDLSRHRAPRLPQRGVPQVRLGLAPRSARVSWSRWLSSWKAMIDSTRSIVIRPKAGWTAPFSHWLSVSRPNVLSVSARRSLVAFVHRLARLQLTREQRPRLGLPPSVQRVARL